MKFLPVVAVAVIAVPLPAGPPNVQKWIKINEVEYPVPFGMHPNDYREQLARAGIAMVDLHPLPTANAYPRPIIRQQPLQQPLLQQQQQVFSQPQPVQSFYPQQAYLQQTPSTTALYGYGQPAWQATPSWVPNNNPSGTRVSPTELLPRENLSLFFQQWVKLREGTDPIEVPLGAEPQSYLETIRHANLRYLSEVRTDEGQGMRRGLRRVKVAPQLLPEATKEVSTTKSSYEYWAPSRGKISSPAIVSPEDTGAVYSEENLSGLYVPAFQNHQLSRGTVSRGVVSKGVVSMRGASKGVGSGGLDLKGPTFIGGRWAEPPNFFAEPFVASGKSLQLKARSAIAAFSKSL